MLKKTIQELRAQFFRIAATAKYLQDHPEVLQGYLLYARKLGFFNTFARLFKIIKRGGPRQPSVPAVATTKLALASGSHPIIILTTIHCLYVARCISVALSRIEIRSYIIHESPARGYSSDLHFVICPQMFAKLPAFYVALQMEQSVSSRWFTGDYLSTLQNAVAILDYSTVNIGFLTRKGLDPRRFFYVPLGYTAKYGPVPDHAFEDCDVVFYGDTNNRRRLKFLQELKKHFRVKVIGNLFGEKLYAELARARIVVNIHYYAGALLETTRIWECLSLHKLVVSERSSDMDQHADLNQLVDFVEVDDVTSMVERVRFWLENDDLRHARIAENRLILNRQPNRFEYFFYRFLLATDNITFGDFWRLAGHKTELQSDAICLSLPEYVERATEFNKDNHYGFSCFPGLRHTQSWIGCGMSYKFLIMLARQKGLPQITICEDDVEFPPHYGARLQDIRDHLGNPNVEWDVFSALMAGLDKDVQILDVHSCKDQRFATVDKLMSMVFNVYNQTVFDLIANWDPINHDVTTNTIDRYLGSKRVLKILVVEPFLVGHKESQHSTLWGVKNSHYTDLIHASSALLKNKIEAGETRTRSLQP